VSILTTLALIPACSSKQFESVSSSAQAQRCVGHSDIVITATDYVGTKEDIIPFEPHETVGHAAALELVSKAPTVSAEYAAAWVNKNTNVINVSVYNVGTQTLTNPVQLPWSTGTQKWVRRLGHERETCTAIAGIDTCGWFTWADSWGCVNWVAIGSGGSRSSERWLPGYAASGDTGWDCALQGLPVTNKKLLAYVSSSRTAIMGAFIDSAGNAGTPFQIHALPTNWKAYQTAVSWSGRCGERWLVAWTEQNDTDGKNGRIKTAYVTYGGVVVGANHVMYCEGGATQEYCAVSRPLPPSADAAKACGCRVAPTAQTFPTCFA
jgi:hypothetical protein